MSYAGYFRSLPFSLPTGLTGLGLAWLYAQTIAGRPKLGIKEISKAEYNATPKDYLLAADMHPTRCPKVPHMKDIPDAFGELEHKVAHKKGHH